MDPITIAAIAALITAGLFLILTLVLITGSWLKNKITENLKNKKDTIAIGDKDKIKEIIGEALGETSTVSIDELDMMLATVDEKGDVKDIEFICSEEGMDESTRNFMRNHDGMIMISNNA